jgi:hypothetical protein
MYLDELAAAIRSFVPDDRVPEGDADALFRLYALLLRVKGSGVTESDVHDAWAAWMASQDAEHESLLPYSDLNRDVQQQDRVFSAAIESAAQQFDLPDSSHPLFADVLFPTGPPGSDADTQQITDLYKMMVQSSESLVSRRQAVNTFFLTMNVALLTASGLVVQGSGNNALSAWGLAILTFAGAILSVAWRSLIVSFGQLNRGKFQVINTLERYLKASVYAAEWEALARGENPKVYRSFTSREVWVPNALAVLYALATIGAILVAAGCVPWSPAAAP